MSAVDLEALQRLPLWLRENGHFYTWRFEERHGRRTKVPYNPRTGGRASSADPATAASFDEALAALRRDSDFAGVGVCIFGELSCIDIDHCFDPELHEFSEMAQDLLDTFDSYADFSPSGMGLHLWFRAPGFRYDKDRYLINNRHPVEDSDEGLEVYVAGATNKFVTITGVTAQDRDIMDGSEQLPGVLEKYMRRDSTKQPKKPVDAQTPAAAIDISDEELLDRIRWSKQGPKFEALWSGRIPDGKSHSEADAALCSILAFWTGRDAERIDRLFRQSGLMRDKWDEHRGKDTYGARTIQGAIGACSEVWTGGKSRSVPALPADETGEIAVNPVLIGMQPETAYSRSDAGNGQLFADFYADLARYVPERRRWYVYDGTVWHPDVESVRVRELAKRLQLELMVYAAHIGDRDYLDHVVKWQSLNVRDRLLRDAQTVRPLYLEELDQRTDLLNLRNGTLDLSTRTFRPHSPEDLLTKIADVNYDPAATLPRWEQFIDEIMADDHDVAVYLQKALGYALTGKPVEDRFFVLYGPSTRNGKSTLMESVGRVLGDYSTTANPATFTARHPDTANGSAPSEDIARLAGVRLVSVSEHDAGAVFNIALLKLLTGGTRLTARFLHENSFSYLPQFSLFMDTNFLPSVSDQSLFSSDRVSVIPFLRHFDASERDTGLRALFRRPRSRSAILNWLIEGLRLYQETGLQEPASVSAATRDYERQSDKVGRFLEDTCEQDPAGEIRTAELYERFKSWCAVNGHRAEAADKFKTRISRFGEVRKVRPQGADRSTSPVMTFLGWRCRNTSSASWGNDE